MVAAHMGGMCLQNEVMELLAGKADLYFDTAYAADPWIDKPTVEKIIRTHGADKILFGSDFPWHLPSQEIELIDSLNHQLRRKRADPGRQRAEAAGDLAGTADFIEKRKTAARADFMRGRPFLFDNQVIASRPEFLPRARARLPLRRIRRRRRPRRLGSRFCTGRSSASRARRAQARP